MTAVSNKSYFVIGGLCKWFKCDFSHWTQLSNSFILKMALLFYFILFIFFIGMAAERIKKEVRGGYCEYKTEIGWISKCLTVYGTFTGIYGAISGVACDPSAMRRGSVVQLRRQRMFRSFLRRKEWCMADGWLRPGVHCPQKWKALCFVGLPHVNNRAIFW